MSPGPDEPILEKALTEALEAALGTLQPREAMVLRLYFGLGDEDPLSLEKIGTRLGVTRERVRQIKQQALQRLRHASRARVLKPFTD